MWDTMALYFVPSPQKPLHRKIRRKACKRSRQTMASNTLWLMPATWMVFSDTICLSPSVYGGHDNIPLHSFHVLLSQINHSWHCIQKIDCMVELTPTVWVQFNHLKLKHLLNDTGLLTYQEHHLTLDDYFDAYEKLPIEAGEFYFDALSNLDPYDVPSCPFDELRADYVPVRPTTWTVDCCSSTTCPPRWHFNDKSLINSPCYGLSDWRRLFVH